MKIIVKEIKIEILKKKIKNSGAGSGGKPGLGVSFAKGTVGGARICDSSLRLHNEAIVSPSLLGNSSFPLRAFWWHVLFILTCTFARGPSRSGWIPRGSAAFEAAGGARPYSRDIRGLRGAKKTFSGTPNPWAASKYHNLSA